LLALVDLNVAPLVGLDAKLAEVEGVLERLSSNGPNK